jgi:hypothetical protein
MHFLTPSRHFCVQKRIENALFNAFVTRLPTRICVHCAAILNIAVFAFNRTPRRRAFDKTPPAGAGWSLIFDENVPGVKGQEQVPKRG